MESPLDSTPTAPPMCERPPEGWICTRKAGHKGPCAAMPTSRAAKVFIPTEALMRLRQASERAHQARRHHGTWDACEVETCTRDRAYLGEHGIVDARGRRLR